MVSHIFLPELNLQPGHMIPDHQLYLSGWHEEAVQKAEDGDVSASMCLQGALIELVQFGHLTQDWIGIFDEYLTDANRTPIAYSEKFGRRLFGFESQAKQSTILAIHTRWWIDSIQKGAVAVEHDRYAEMLLPCKLMNGLDL